MWPRKIATAKPHERPKPFDRWYFRAKAKGDPELPMATELTYKVCMGDTELFDLINYHLEQAFDAGKKSRD